MDMHHDRYTHIYIHIYIYINICIVDVHITSIVFLLVECVVVCLALKSVNPL